MEPPTREQITLAKAKVLERMAKAGWIKQMASHVTGATSVQFTAEGEQALRALRKLLNTSAGDPIMPAEYYAFLLLVSSGELQFLD